MRWRYLIVILLLLFSRSGRAQGWIDAAPSGQQFSQGQIQKVVLDAAGNVYMTGWYNGYLTLGSTVLESTNGTVDLFVAKRSPTGQWLWAATAGGNNTDAARSLQLDAAGNVYVCGYFVGQAFFGQGWAINSSSLDPNAFVAKLNPQGQWQWAAQTLSANVVFANDLVTVPHGPIYITGQFSGASWFGTTRLVGDHAPFLASIDSTGQWLWGALMPCQWVNLNGDVGLSIGLDRARNLYVGGTFSSTTTFGTHVLSTPAGGHTDIFLAKLTPAHQWAWARALRGDLRDLFGGMVVDAARNRIHVAGSFRQTGTFGTSTLTSRGSYDIFTTAFDTAGTPLAAQQAGGRNDDLCDGLALDPAGNPVLTGRFRDTATFGSETLISAGLYDLFLAGVSGGQWYPVARAGGPDNEQGCHLAIAEPAHSTRYAYVGGGFQSPSLTFGPVTLTHTGIGSAPLLAVYGYGPPQGLPEAPAAAALTLAPNPAHGTVQLRGLPAAGTLQLLDALGRTVRTYPLTSGTAEVELNLTGLPPGLYTVRCGAVVRRLVVE